MTINQRDHVVGLLDHEEWNLQQALVRPCPEAALAVYAVGRAVGNVRNEGAGLVQPLV